MFPLPSPTIRAVLLVLLVSATEAKADTYFDSTTAARYAPDREAHIVHTRLELRVDVRARSIEGSATVRFTPLFPGVERLRLNAEQLQISGVSDLAGTALPFELGAPHLDIRLPRAAGPGETLSVCIRYRASPDRGIYFNLPDATRPDRPVQAFTQGEAEDSHFWFPCWDSPNDRATSEMLATVPPGMIAISNGRLLGRSEAGGGWTTFHYLESVPHPAYLTSLVVGDFRAIEDSWRGIPLISYVKPQDLDRGRATLGRLKDMVEYFSEVTGVPYPYEKYSQTFVAEFQHGGMENISATTNTEGALYDRRAQLDSRNESLVSHELAHQWFGDFVTCRDWAHVWLNEGFATFMQHMYYEHWLGQDEYALENMNGADSYFREDTREYRRSMLEHRRRGPEAVFDSHSYPRGAWVLHMLRYELGDDAFWRGVHLYLTRLGPGLAVTADFRNALEEASGRSLEEFFHQWVELAGYPELEIRQSWQDSHHQLVLSVRQVQRVTEQTPNFRVPLEFEIQEASGARRVSVNLEDREATFVFPAAGRPRNVRFDPRQALLCKVTFEKPEGDWLFQLHSCPDAWGRMQALKALGAVARSDSATEALGEALRSDSFHGVREAAAEALGKLRATRSAALLVEGLADREARVRKAAAAALGELSASPLSTAALSRAAHSDSSYGVVSAALLALAKSHSEAAYSEAVRALSLPSFEEIIRRGALDALAECADARAIPIAREWARPGHATRARVNAVAAFGSLVRARQLGGQSTEATDLDARRFLESLLRDGSYQVRGNACEALGKLGGSDARGALERARRDDPEFRVRDKARLALAALAGGQGEARDLVDLRRRVSELESHERDQKRMLDELEARGSR